jgi:hypothetical protein
MYQKKYLKYKKKYLDLKGGDIISYDDKIDDNIISDVSFEDYPNPYEKTFPMIKKELLIYDVDSIGTNIQPLHVYEDSNKNIKKEHYKNYFTYAYNKDSYKNKKNSKKSSKHRILKIKNRHLKYAPL